MGINGESLCVGVLYVYNDDITPEHLVIVNLFF